MPADIDCNGIEVVDHRVAVILRSKTPGERMRLALESNEFVRTMMAASLRANHLDWSDDQVRDAISRRVLGDANRVATTCGERAH